MEPRKVLKKIVLERLNAIVDVKGTKKSLGEAIIDGTASLEQVKHLNFDNKDGFPSNIFSSTCPSEPEYSSTDAMKEFLLVLNPYLSNQRMYDFVDKLCAVEFQTERSNTVMRGNRMARFALALENVRYDCGASEALLSHMHIYAIQTLNKNANPQGDFDNLVELIANLPPCYEAAKNFEGIKEPLNDKPSAPIEDYRKLISENTISAPFNVEKKSSVTAKNFFSNGIWKTIKSEKSLQNIKSTKEDLENKIKNIEAELEKNPTSKELLKKKEAYIALLAKLIIENKPSTRNRSATK